MTDDDMFGEFDPKRYDLEVEERWPGEALDESKTRTSRRSKAEWRDALDEMDEISQAFADLLHEGGNPTDDAAMETAERHRLHIDRWFYPCSHAMHEALGIMYVEDARFTAYWERFAPGLAPFVRDAIAANATFRTTDQDRLG